MQITGKIVWYDIIKRTFTWKCQVNKHFCIQKVGWQKTLNIIALLLHLYVHTLYETLGN